MKGIYCAVGMFRPLFSSAFLSSHTGGTIRRLGGAGGVGMCSPKPSPQTRLPKLKQPHRELRKLSKLN